MTQVFVEQPLALYGSAKYPTITYYYVKNMLISQCKCIANHLPSLVLVKGISNYIVVPKEVSPLVQTFVDS